MIGAATAAPIFLAGRRLAGPPAGLAAALLLAVSPTHVAESRTVGADVPMAFGAAMALYFIVRLATSAEKRGSCRRAWVGLAVSCKYPAALLLLPLAAVLVVPAWSGASRGRRLRELPRALLAALIAFGLTSPWVLLDLPDAWRAVAFERFHMAARYTSGGGSSGRAPVATWPTCCRARWAGGIWWPVRRRW